MEVANDTTAFIVRLVDKYAMRLHLLAFAFADTLKSSS
jgi:hypothetical protein